MEEKKILFGLDPKSYEHNFDKNALNILTKVPKFDVVTNFFLNWGYLKWHVIELQGSNFLVTRESCPELYEMIHNVADTLDVRPLPRFYTQWGYSVNGYTTGYKEDTLLILNSGTIDLLTDDELRFVAGHEMGHIKSGHVLYHMMASLFNNAISQIPLVSDLTMPVYYALMYWNRMSEFTADRAGLLACQNIDAAISAIIKMSGVPLRYYDQINPEAFIKQANEFKSSFTGFTDNAIKTLTIANSSHPWTVLRAAELLEWYDSGEYDRIMNSIHSAKCPDCGNQIPASASQCPFCGSNLE